MSDIVLDVCGLDPPEPMERILDALDQLANGTRLAVLIEREPHPLLIRLARHGYHHQIGARADGRYDLVIWRAP